MNNNKPTFFTSDWHIGHEASIEFDNRPFTDTEHMHNVLIKKYNTTVPKDGVCYFLGDMGLTKSDNIIKVVNKLNGTKILVLGNHDGNLNSMYKKGFDVVMHGAVLFVAKERLTLSHCPLLDVYREDTIGMKGCTKNEPWHGNSKDKNRRLSFTNEGQFHLHGHIHSPNNNKSELILDRQRDVGVVGNKYSPVSIKTIESWINKTGGKNEQKTKKK